MPFRHLNRTVSIFVEHVRSGAYLYGQGPWTYTHCQEKYDIRQQLAVGGFDPNGLRVKDGHVGYDRHGVACAWRF